MAGVVPGLLPTGETEPVFHRYAQLCAVYPQLDEDMVSCNMDLKPESVLFDGKQVWLIDWMAAHRNDRYFDLSVVANFVIQNDADELTYLERYFGEPPSAHQLARFFLMRQALHMLSAAVFLLLGSGGKPIRQIADCLRSVTFTSGFGAGEIDLAENELKVVYGRVHWAKPCESARDPRFDEAVRDGGGTECAAGQPPATVAERGLIGLRVCELCGIQRRSSQRCARKEAPAKISIR
jgi:hypothetical protein